MLNPNNVFGVIDGVIGMSAVKRYHGRNTIKTQTLADHSARVAQLAFFLALEFYENDYAKACYVATFGLFHDFPESLLECDIPTPIKAKSGIGIKVKAVEVAAVTALFPDDSYLQNLMMEVGSEDDFNIMKLADLLDLGLYVRGEMKMGNNSLEILYTAFQNAYNKFSPIYKDLSFARACENTILGLG